ncbi:unnamed protein product [Rotaria sp. Silwood2]|nr:unnamed protein product [Rotaria sp. Silwood2]CAF3849534.1 unnamed protein product [Rotaria sp. Silwood2]CAF4005179.1 unnamed protein product [Rotaria sp. Silwood2]
MSTPQPNKYNTNPLSGTGSPGNENNTSGKLPSYYYDPQNSGSNDNSMNPQYDQNRSRIDDDRRSTSTSSKSQPTTGANMNADEMLGKIVQFGKDSCTIKAYFQCGEEELFALECERPMLGYDGRCPKCGRQHVPLDKTRGFYAAVNSVYNSLGQQKLEKERLQGRKRTEKLLSITENLPPLDCPIIGENKGIEGDSNSCYMDATIFCMFAYCNVFDSLLHMPTNKNSIKKLQDLLRENIVHVLRHKKVGFVERDALFHLRAQLSEATGDPSFKEVEKDPSEFLRALEEHFQYAPLKTIPPDQPPNATASNVTTNIMWEMFDANPHNLLSTTIAGIFRNSLSEIPVKLATIPPFLILVAPRHTRSQRSYRYIIPDRQITLDNDIVQLVCLKCRKTNHGQDQLHDFYSCDECYSKESPSLTTPTTDAKVACYCRTCLMKLHEGLSHDVSNHNTRKIQINKHKLNLFAVLCIEIAHYVAFVKCKKQDQQGEWLFFDSMSDRILNEKNIPLVDRVPAFDRWVEEAEQNKYFFQDLDKLRSQARPSSQKFDENAMRQLRLFRDGAFFFYENSSVNYQ